MYELIVLTYNREHEMSGPSLKEEKIYHVLNAKLDRIIRLLEKIIDMLEHRPQTSKTSESYGQLTEYLDAITLLSLPDHLRRTAIALAKLGGEATAEDVSRETGRARAVESAYLNQLVAMGYIAKKRKGRKVYFYFPRE